MSLVENGLEYLIYIKKGDEMEYKEFVNLLSVSAKKVGFRKYKKDFIYDAEKIVIIVNIQKSNFDESYYINYGFILKEIHNLVEYPKINECDYIGRFTNYLGDKEEYNFKLNSLEKELFENGLKRNISKFILPLIEEGIWKYFDLFPEAIASTKLVLKQYLNNIEM